MRGFWRRGIGMVGKVMEGREGSGCGGEGLEKRGKVVEGRD